MPNKLVRMGIWLILAILGLTTTGHQPVFAQLAAPQAPSAPPDIVVDEPLLDWTIGNSMLYRAIDVPPARVSLPPAQQEPKTPICCAGCLSMGVPDAHWIPRSILIVAITNI